MDIEMPVMNGLKSSKHIKGLILDDNSKYHDAYIVAYTSFQYNDIHDEVEAALINDLLIKP